MSLLDLVAGARTITVVGLAKNAGKTTVINHLLARLPGRVGLASLGLDGEARDQLTGLPKPRVLPPRGTLVATAEGLLEPGAQVREVLPFRTAVGPVVLVEAGGGHVIVSGPARLEELDRTVAALHAAGCDRVLLEGALGRLGTAAPQRAQAVILAAGASLANGRDDYALKVKLALDALDLPLDAEACQLTLEHVAGFEEEAVARIADAGAERVELAGALTGPLLERLLRRRTPTTLVVADATRVLARPQQVARARRGAVTAAARRPLAIVAVTANPFHPDTEFSGEEAFTTLTEAVAGRWPVHDVVSGMMHG